MRLLAACVLAALSLAASACWQDDAPVPPPMTCPAIRVGAGLLGADCDPLVPTQCGFPFPSNVYLADDPSTVTGKRVRFGSTTLPRYPSGSHIDPSPWTDRDGFSPGQPALTQLPGATATGLPTQDTIARSLDPDSPTILLDAATGERVAHFAELDVSISSETEADQTLIIRPMVRLEDAARYIVAVRHLVDKDGKPIAPTPAFKALRDGEASCEPSVGTRKDLYADIFSRLEKAGIPRTDLQIAWDYSTASRDDTTARLVAMRDDALAKVGTDGPTYTLTNVEENPNPHIRRRLTGKMTVPLYLDKPGPGGKLVLDSKGLPVQNGTADFDFVVHIPNSTTTGMPGPPLQNGHGLFGSKNEGQDSYLAQIADEKRFVAFGVDLIGMASEDVSTVADDLVSDLGAFKNEVDRQHQGILNSLLAMRMMRGRFAKEPQTIIDGHPTIDPSQGYYRGDSQGGIFGTTYMAVSTDVTRGLLSVPGMNYSLLLNRSADFGFDFVVLGSTFHTGKNLQLILGLIQMLWDRTEPDGYAPYIAENMLPGTPHHDVLLHVAIGDHQVSPLGAHLIARSVKATSVKPVNRSLWSIAEADAPFMGSGMVEFDFGLPPSPTGDVPPSDGADPHGKVRFLPAAIDQEDTFFRTGVIKQYCSGKCTGM